MGIDIISNNSVSVHEYRGKIDSAIQELEKSLRKTEASLDAVAQTWKDENHDKFCNEFSNDKQQISNINGKLENYSSNILYNLELRLKDYEETDISI